MGLKIEERKHALLNKLPFLLILLLFTALPARPENQNKIVLKSTAELETVVVNKNGEREIRRVDVSKAAIAPGDTIVFTTSYTNGGDKPADTLVVTNPVPEQMAYIGDTAEGKGSVITFSVDNGKTYGVPKSLTIPLPDGKARSAVPADYTHIKWTVSAPVAPGGKGSVSFKAKVK